MSKRVAIIGAGISGLSLCYYLEKKGYTPILIEKNKSLGGAINTKEIDGFIVENGPNTVLLNPEFEELIGELGLSSSIKIADIQKQKNISV